MNIRHSFFVIILSFTALLPEMSFAECLQSAETGKWYYLTNQDEVDEDAVESCLRTAGFLPSGKSFTVTLPLTQSTWLDSPSGEYGPNSLIEGAPSGSEPAPIADDSIAGARDRSHVRVCEGATPDVRVCEGATIYYSEVTHQNPATREFVTKERVIRQCFGEKDKNQIVPCP